MAAAPGWYVDPTDSSNWRFWDGAGWTTRTATRTSATGEQLPRPTTGTGTSTAAGSSTTATGGRATDSAAPSESAEPTGGVGSARFLSTAGRILTPPTQTNQAQPGSQPTSGASQSAPSSASDSEGTRGAVGMLIGLIIGGIVLVRSFLGLYPMPFGLTLWLLTIPMMLLPFFLPTFGAGLGALVGIGALIGIVVSLFTTSDWLPYLLVFGAALVAFAVGALRADTDSTTPTAPQHPAEPPRAPVPVRSTTTQPRSTGAPAKPDQLPPTFTKQPNKLSQVAGFGSGQPLSAAAEKPDNAANPDLLAPSGNASTPSALGTTGKAKSLGNPWGQTEPSTTTPPPAESAPSVKFCSECGEPATGATFCAGCGVRLDSLA